MTMPPLSPTLFQLQKSDAMYAPADGPEARFVGGCTVCGLTGMLYKPCRGGKTWTGRCRTCGLRSFSPHPRAFYAATGLVELTRGRGDENYLRLLAQLEQRGARALATRPWQAGLVGSRSVVQLPDGQACLSCGEPRTAVVRRDRHGRPHATCAACNARSFIRHQVCLHRLLGWTHWLEAPGHDAAWWEAYQHGQRTWAAWATPASVEPSTIPEADAQPASQEMR